MENYNEAKSNINYVSVLVKQTYVEILQLLRTPLFISAILLLCLLILFFPVKDESKELVLIFFSGLILLIVAVERLGKRIALERVVGWFKLLQVSPLPPTIFIGAKLICTLLICTLVLLLMYFIGSFKLGVGVNIIDWLRIFFALILGIIPFAFFGIAVGYLLNPKSIDPIIALLVPIALLTCGLPVPFADNKWFQYLINLLPFYHYSKFVQLVSGINIPLVENKKTLVDGIIGIITKPLSKGDSVVEIQDNLITHALYLFVFGLIFYLVSVWAYKRDQSLS